MARYPAKPNLPESPEQSDKQLSRRIHIIVKRDITSAASTTIWQHEKPILEAIFGEDTIQEIEADTLNEGYTETVRPDLLIHNKTQDKIARPSDSQGMGFVFIGNAEAEYHRIAKIYAKLEDEKRPTVEVLYGRFQEGRFAKLLGQPELADLPNAQLRALILDYGYAPIPHKDASADEKNAVYKQRQELVTADHATLVALAEQVGVQIG
jgi:hypothetical protein